jgi:FtsP/CotA-like multicopper oxidase with cupredoxin domain
MALGPPDIKRLSHSPDTVRSLGIQLMPPAKAGRKIRKRVPVASLLCVLMLCGARGAFAADGGVCPRPEAGSVVTDAPELRSQDGRLELTLTERNERAADGSMRYCFIDGAGHQAPTLRVKPGDELVIHLKDALTDLDTAPVGSASRAAAHEHMHQHAHDGGVRALATDPCQRGAMVPFATNLHFHGLSVPPVCHQDESLTTTVLPSDPPFEYRLRIPDDQPSGLYWYHPHVHGFSARHIQGGASGALIVEGIERFNPELRGLPERVLVIRDQDLLRPQAPVPATAAGAAGTRVQHSGGPNPLVDSEGDAINTGTGAGKPAKDLSVNFVPVPWPDYPPADIAMRPGERQLWRVLNGSSLTYLNLAVMVQHGSHFRPQWLGVTAIDGIPLNAGGSPGPATSWRKSVIISPGARVEFIMIAPPAGGSAMLVTRGVDTGEAGENDPARPLVLVTTQADAAEPAAILPTAARAAPPPSRPWLGDVKPIRERHLYFSEDPQDLQHPDVAGHFYLTVEGQQPKAFDPADGPNIVVRQGEVEDWIIENRSPEVHAFHIHQLHFQMREFAGLPANEPFLRDTINVPYWSPTMQGYPTVRVRMDFRDPDTVGDFVYHCHLLDHEDAGMMGLIRVEPALQQQ